ncbi:flagellar biosynthesis regulatory protein FlaF [Shimia sp. SK013]|uniref:flagellar biosynthesis regulator FlaF n=1 Tax=Shimia sp. SK013 TaxID=1389006 RepID=UPI0006B5AF25|nr:flagellar biosynthesis regulator FlaF [Shimia sp. SK013]KPA20323.1 flagellar biosynthesis regulatory protein FlaF [Shimia sp. SK013]
MSVNALAERGYGQAVAQTRTPRSIEYDVVARTTHRLKAAAQKGTLGFGALAEAVHDNRTLWTFLAASVADDENQLPQQLRAQIFYLAEFTRLHSSKVLKEGASVRPLLEVNMAILRGLRGGQTS